MQNVNQFIKGRRKAPGWTETQMAKRTGLPDMKYYGVEAHDGELVSVTSPMNVQRLAEDLGEPVHEFFGTCNPSDIPKRRFLQERIVEALKKRSVTPEDMAEQMGFTPTFVAII